MADNQDLYKILQIDPSAEPEVVKAAFRTLAQKYHPDRNEATSSSDRMKQLNRAYSTLGNPTFRATYDRERAERITIGVWGGGGTATGSSGVSANLEDWPEAPRVQRVSGLSFRARNFRQSKFGKLGFWIGLVIGLLSALSILSDVGGDSVGVTYDVVTAIWVGLMAFLIAWGLIWSIGDLLQQVYKDSHSKEGRNR